MNVIFTAILRASIFQLTLSLASPKFGSQEAAPRGKNIVVLHLPRSGGVMKHTWPSSRNKLNRLPRSGGSAVCEAVRRSNSFSTPSTANCWEMTDGPEWCCLNHAAIKERTCEARLRSNYSFTMIERYMVFIT